MHEQTTTTTTNKQTNKQNNKNNNPQTTLASIPQLKTNNQQTS
jgi:hypothetical protein